MRHYKKQILGDVAHSRRFRSTSPYVKKDERVQALSWLREQLR